MDDWAIRQPWVHPPGKLGRGESGRNDRAWGGGRDPVRKQDLPGLALCELRATVRREDDPSRFGTRVPFLEGGDVLDLGVEVKGAAGIWHGNEVALG